MKLPRRTVEIFSLSFLDCICCGFGAIILLLVLTEYGQPIQIEEGRQRLNGQVKVLDEQLHEIRGETELLNRELKGRLEELQKEKMRLAQLAVSMQYLHHHNRQLREICWEVRLRLPYWQDMQRLVY